jgi:hypothetical protein
LEENDIRMIDSLYVPIEADKRLTRKAIDALTKGQVPQLDVATEQAGVSKGLLTLGNQRGFVPSDISSKTWKEQFKDLEWEVKVDVTGENVDQNAVDTLNTMLTTIARNPNILQDPNVKMLWNKILMQTSVVSPAEIVSTPSPIVSAPTPSPSGGSMMG